VERGARATCYPFVLGFARGTWSPGADKPAVPHRERELSPDYSNWLRLLDQPRLAWVRLESEQNKTIPGPRGSGRKNHPNREVKFQAGKMGGSVPEWEAQCLTAVL
jgi:hypothetical protein